MLGTVVHYVERAVLVGCSGAMPLVELHEWCSDAVKQGCSSTI
jgi:hypothetical protein